MTTKINCIAIDDEPVALEIMADYITKVPFLSLEGTFRNALHALDFIQRAKVDLIFLDINMPDINGLQFLKSLHNRPLVIFTTAYTEFAVESYDLNALDYLLKPIEFDRFLKAVNKIPSQNNIYTNYQQPEKEKQDNFVVLKSGSKSYKVNYRDIMFVEGAGNYLTFHTLNLKIMVLMNMEEALKLLPDTDFVRIHKSYIVSLRHTVVIENHQIQINNIKIPIGNYYREMFLRRLNR